MSRRALAIVVLLLLLAVGAGVWVAFLEEAPGPAAPVVGPAPPPGDAPREAPRRTPGRRTEEPGTPAGQAPAAEPERAVDPVAPAEPRVPERNVRLRVVTSEGLPAEGASVEVRNDVGTWGPDTEASVVRTKAATDAEGRAEVPFRGWAAYAHAVWRDQAGVADLDLGADAETTIVLGPSTTVRVRVLGPSDVPVAGAFVRVSWWRPAAGESFDHASLVGRAGDDGRAEFAAMPVQRGEDDATHVEVRARGFTPAEESFGPEDLESEVTLRLAPASSVRGRCIDERGRPVGGVSVSVPERGGTPVQTGADGRFTLDDVPRGGADVRFASDAHAPAALRGLEISGSEHDVGDVVLRPGGKVTGLFVDLDGKPVAGGNVWITDAGMEWTYRSVVVGDDGRYTFEHVPPGPQSLRGEEPPAEGASWSATREASLEDVRADGGETRLVLTGALFLHIRFLDAADRSPVKVGSADVNVVPLTAGDGGGGWGWSGGQIDSVRFEIAEAGPYRVEVEVPGYEKAVVEKVEILPDREVRIDVLFRKR